MTNQIANTLPDKTQDELAVINYGLETLLMNIYKISIIFGLAYLMNIYNLVLFTFFISSIMRFFTSGVHAKNWWVCLLISSVNIIGSALFGLYVVINTWTYLTLLVISLFLIFKYAPADTEAKPIINPRKRRFNKIGALLSTTLLAGSILILGNATLISVLAADMVIISFYITPVAYKLFGQRYNNYLYFKSDS